MSTDRPRRRPHRRARPTPTAPCSARRRPSPRPPHSKRRGPGRGSTTARTARRHRRCCSAASRRKSMETAYRTVFEQYGAPLLSFGVTFVHGKMYRRLIPLIGGDKTGPTAAQAGAVAGDAAAPGVPPPREAGPQGDSPNGTTSTPSTTGRPSGRSGSPRTERSSPSTSPASTTSGSPTTSPTSTVTTWPAGSDITSCTAATPGRSVTCSPTRTTWGLDPTKVMQLLEGASPATTEGAECGRRIADALRAAGVDPLTIRSLDQVRAGAGGVGGARRLPRPLRLASRELVRHRGPDDERAPGRDLHADPVGRRGHGRVGQRSSCRTRPTIRDAGRRRAPAVVRRAPRRRSTRVRPARRQRPAHCRVADGDSCGAPTSKPAVASRRAAG